MGLARAMLDPDSLRRAADFILVRGFDDESPEYCHPSPQWLVNSEQWALAYCPLSYCITPPSPFPQVR